MQPAYVQQQYGAYVSPRQGPAMAPQPMASQGEMPPQYAQQPPQQPYAYGAPMQGQQPMMGQQSMMSSSMAVGLKVTWKLTSACGAMVPSSGVMSKCGASG